jgi:hypothetical protein
MVKFTSVFIIVIPIPNMKLYRVSFAADKFAALPSTDQLFFVRLAQARNDIRHIQNLMIAGVQAVDVHTGIDQKLAMHQLLFSVRLVYSAIYEAWCIVKSDWAALEPAYASRLKHKASAALDELKNYFGVKNLVKQVRNKFASHYDAKVIAVGLAQMAGKEGQSLVTSEGIGNVFYLSAEDVRNVSVLGLVDPSLLQPGGFNASKAQTAVRKLYDEALHVLALLSDFSDGALLLIAVQCAPTKPELVLSAAISDPQTAQSVIFVDEDLIRSRLNPKAANHAPGCPPSSV